MATGTYHQYILTQIITGWLIEGSYDEKYAFSTLPEAIKFLGQLADTRAITIDERKPVR